MPRIYNMGPSSAYKKRAGQYKVLVKTYKKPTLAKKVNVLMKNLKNEELKNFDTALTFDFDATMEVAGSGVLGQLNLIPQGATDVTRIGRKCVIKSIYIKGNVAMVPAANATASISNYLWVIWDKQANGAVPAQSEVMTSTSVNTALHNLSNAGRFVILKKFKFILNSHAGVTTAYNNTRRDVEWYKQCNIPIEFSSTAGAITEIKSNNLFLMYGSVGGDDLTSFAGICRLRFSDE